MARRALIDAHFDRAERYARLASAALPNNSIPWLVLGQSILLNELEAANEGGGETAAPSDEARIREAETCFTQALELAQAERSGVERSAGADRTRAGENRTAATPTARAKISNRRIASSAKMPTACASMGLCCDRAAA